jgi:hypothetical protein
VLFDAASAFAPSDDGTDMVRAGSLASGGDFLQRLAGCQGKDLIPQLVPQSLEHKVDSRE